MKLHFERYYEHSRTHKNKTALEASVVFGLMLMSFMMLTQTAAALDLGDTAPQLTIQKWVKGDPVNLEEGRGKTVYVVEFWATWCPPCRKSIPHLTEVQKKFKDKGVVIVGISSEDQEKVVPFVKKMAEKMTYTVAIDKEGKTTKAYMDGLGLMGIPTAIIVDKSGKIAWYGHPMDGLEQAIQAILDNTFDRKAFMEKAKEKKKALRGRKLIEVYLYLAGKTEENDIRDLVGKRILKYATSDADVLNEFAWSIITNKNITTPDLDLAFNAADKAMDLTQRKSPAVIDTYAYVLYKQGKIKEAITEQKKAISLSDEKSDLKEFKERLQMYQDALKK